MKIGVCGFIGSGKNSFCNILEQKYGFTTLAFADCLKDCLSIIFSWDREMLSGNTPESRLWREQTDEWWSQKLGIKDFSPRFAMQYIGTQVLREGFHNNIWVDALEKQLDQFERVCVSDCRFQNEIAMLKNKNATIVEIQRNTPPLFYSTAELANSGCQTSKNLLQNSGIHVSEWEWIGFSDCVITNNSTLEDLEIKVEKFLEKLNVTF